MLDTFNPTESKVITPIFPCRTSNKPKLQIVAELEAKIGAEHFIGASPIVTVNKHLRPNKPVVKVNPLEKFENAYVSLAKNMGKFTYDKKTGRLI